MTMPFAYNTTQSNWLTFSNLSLFNLHTPTFFLILKVSDFLLFFPLNWTYSLRKGCLSALVYLPCHVHYNHRKQKAMVFSIGSITEYSLDAAGTLAHLTKSALFQWRSKKLATGDNLKPVKCSLTKYIFHVGLVKLHENPIFISPHFKGVQQPDLE